MPSHLVYMEGSVVTPWTLCGAMVMSSLGKDYLWSHGSILEFGHFMFDYFMKGILMGRVRGVLDLSLFMGLLDILAFVVCAHGQFSSWPSLFSHIFVVSPYIS